MPLKGLKTKDVIEAFEQFLTDWLPFHGYNLTDHCKAVHVDAGSQLMSKELKDYLRQFFVSLEVAAPEHQEMNGLVERMWQTCRKMSFGLCNEA